MDENKRTDRYAQILINFIEGDDNALSVIYFEMFDELLNFGIKYCADQGLVEDSIQNLFVDLLNNRKKLREVSHLRFYLMKSLRYQIYREMEKFKKQSSFSNINETTFQITYSAENAVISTETEEFRKKTLETLLAKLTVKQREVLYLKFNNGFSYEQLSEFLGIDIASVRKMVYRSLKSIRDHVDKDGTHSMFFFLLSGTKKNFSFS